MHVNDSYSSNVEIECSLCEYYYDNVSIASYITGVLIRWNGTVEWNTGME